jgi:beta-glucanase (GH16 family)
MGVGNAMSIPASKTAFFVCFLLALLFSTVGSNAQDWQQVWADEFNGTTIDRSIWSFDLGPANDNIHCFTDRPENARIEGGRLHIIALEEPYQGYNYTSALLQTTRSAYWRYGRIEASIKLPQTNGLVPAFWMLPEDDLYGWWPESGEIDIMEHPTNQADRIYGTVHTGAYNSFTGSSPRGGSIRIPDAESAFHVYAVEWTPDVMDFYVDGQKYFTFWNSQSGSETWPFDQPFYIILSMAVGGGWVGDPGAGSIFPAVMEVDYVRVYQDMSDAAISGADFVRYHSRAVPYAVPRIERAQVRWGVPEDARIVSGQDTHRITVDWGILGGDVIAEVVTPGGSYTFNLPVTVSPNYIKNSGFEKGVKYWHKTRPFPAEADFLLTSEDTYAGRYCLFVDVGTPGDNPWDAQLSQPDLPLEAGKQYQASFFARTVGMPRNINVAIINSANYDLYANKTVTLTSRWEQYNLSLAVPSDAMASFNFDVGGNIGRYYFDEIVLTTLEADNSNPVVNGDFSAGDAGWTLTTLWPAQATTAVENGEYSVSISHGGVNVWDINVGQAGLLIERDRRYVVSFDAYAAAPRQISALVGKNSAPWTVYSGSQVISLTTTRRTYTYSFTMNHETDSEARLGFDLGGSSIDVVFDNVVLQ